MTPLGRAGEKPNGGGGWQEETVPAAAVVLASHHSDPHRRLWGRRRKARKAQARSSIPLLAQGRRHRLMTVADGAGSQAGPRSPSPCGAGALLLLLFDSG